MGTDAGDGKLPAAKLKDVFAEFCRFLPNSIRVFPNLSDFSGFLRGLGTHVYTSVDREINIDQFETHDRDRRIRSG